MQEIDNAPVASRITPAAPHDFLAVRGLSDDERWASDAWLTLVVRGRVEMDDADQALGEVLDLVRDSGEGPRDLYGPPVEWARERIAEWAAEGSDCLKDEPTRWRDLPQVAAITAVLLCLVAELAAVLSASWTMTWTWGWVLFPYLGSLVALSAMCTWDRVVARRSMGVGVASASGVVLMGSAVLATVLMLSNSHPLARASTSWVLGLAVVYAGIAALLGWVLPTPKGRTREALDDESWRRELARIMRSRGDTTEAQVRRVLDEACAHSQASHRSLMDEFGAPAAYAAQLSPRPIVKSRRSALYRAGMLAMWMWLCGDLLGGQHAWPARAFGWASLACLSVLAVQAVWQFLRESRAHRADA